MAADETIRCMQLPLLNLHLLVPNSSVAEIIGYARGEQIATQVNWYEGQISWRGVKVPVVSVERMCGLETVEPGARSRIAVLYNPRGEEDIPYLGVILQDIPRAFLAEEEPLSGAMAPALCNYLSCAVKEADGDLVIPDIDAIVLALKNQLAS